MTRPYSLDLRERPVARVLAGESVHSVAAILDISAATVVRWFGRHRATGSVAPDKIGGHKVGVSSGHRDWLLERVERDFTLRGLVAELAERDVKVDYVQVFRFAYATGLSSALPSGAVAVLFAAKTGPSLPDFSSLFQRSTSAICPFCLGDDSMSGRINLTLTTKCRLFPILE
ncbi:MAG: helix-turn-helix domain-containing protein [Sphingobium sp.]